MTALPALLLGALAFADDLGIPRTPPWRPEAAGTKSAAAAREDLGSFRERLASDAALVESWRRGLSAVLKFSASRPEALRAGRDASSPMLDEHVEDALGAWRRAADYWMALEQAALRYFAAARAKPAVRAEASALARAARKAQADFLPKWAALAGASPAMEALLDREAEGSPPRLYSSIRSGATPPPAAWAGTWKAPEPAPSPAEEPEPSTPWVDLPVSSQAAWVLAKVRTLAANRPPSGPRPDVLLAPEQLEEARAALEPGDILLARRERYVDSVGLGGYWHQAAVYIGTAKERRRLGFDDKSYRVPTAGDAYVVASGPGGVALERFEAWAPADCLAALRPSLGSSRKPALERALGLLGRPDDPDFDFGDDSALGPAELVFNAYGSFLRPTLASSLGRPAASANGLARLFDEDFGRGRQRLELVFFYDADETWHRARRASVEAFRPSWRRMRWTQQTNGGLP